MGLHRVLSTTRSALFTAMAATVLLLAPAADAQLTPDRTYYGIDREIPITVNLPGGAEGEATIAVFNERGDRVAQANVLAGRVDLATFFPILWGQQQPVVLFAQLYTSAESDAAADAETPIGAPLVLQPLVSPRRAEVTQSLASFRRARQRAEWRWNDDAYVPFFSGMRIYEDKLVKMNTTEGEIVFRLRPDVAPNTVWHIRELVRGGFYTDIPFHRVLPTHPTGKPFVIQAGDPTGQGTGGPGVLIDLEPSTLVHDFGVLSMARGDDPDSNGSQFFVALSQEATVHLNGSYTGFGQAVSGAETIIAIEQTPLEDQRMGRPANPPRIVSAELIDAPPFGTGPEPVQRPQGSGER